MVMFEPFNSNGRKRSAVYHATRLAMLHDRLARKLEQVDHAAYQVEQAATALIEATCQPAVDRPIMPRAASLHMDAGQTLGL
ncbi:hypothetical protein RFM26_01490 [Mesorhizobium sp. VK23B]|uniref:Uncharacterized protein n=1 Tax=Mesorhizobium dulcispinae TaxID=3072316 RepID=A0ABU4X7G7_9HYPH|nr:MULTISPECIES: hypothetical protein [unclassified Mesorhizobium]MDX8464358.1 hypothetical protein [Mesorhizobium sp. VK23B]MDX8470744.1 hypothetical protein [Mesorhizobium sp. VK23A]